MSRRRRASSCGLVTFLVNEADWRETADIVACHALLSAYLRCSDGAGATAFLASMPVDETEFTPHTHTLAAKARALAQTPAHDAWT